jgi:hypothetical protein
MVRGDAGGGVLVSEQPDRIAAARKAVALGEKRMSDLGIYVHVCT